jgi:hypothetical protein
VEDRALGTKSRDATAVSERSGLRHRTTMPLLDSNRSGSVDRGPPLTSPVASLPAAPMYAAWHGIKKL